MNMIYMYILGLFLLAGVSIWALIASRVNRWLVFVIVPLLLSMTLFTWQAITTLQGTPIIGITKEENVRVMWIHNEKPVILYIIKHPGKDTPRYYMIPWTEDNSRQAREQMEKVEKGIPVEGKFEKNPNNAYTGRSGDIIFEPVERFTRDDLKNQGILPPK